MADGYNSDGYRVVVAADGSDRVDDGPYVGAWRIVGFDPRAPPHEPRNGDLFQRRGARVAVIWTLDGVDIAVQSLWLRAAEECLGGAGATWEAPSLPERARRESRGRPVPGLAVRPR